MTGHDELLEKSPISTIKEGSTRLHLLSLFQSHSLVQMRGVDNMGCLLSHLRWKLIVPVHYVVVQQHHNVTLALSMLQPYTFGVCRVRLR